MPRGGLFTRGGPGGPGRPRKSDDDREQRLKETFSTSEDTEDEQFILQLKEAVNKHGSKRFFKDFLERYPDVAMRLLSRHSLEDKTGGDGVHPKVVVVSSNVPRPESTTSDTAPTQTTPAYSDAMVDYNAPLSVSPSEEGAHDGVEGAEDQPGEPDIDPLCASPVSVDRPLTCSCGGSVTIKAGASPVKESCPHCMTNIGRLLGDMRSIRDAEEVEEEPVEDPYENINWKPVSGVQDALDRARPGYEESPFK